MATQEKLAGEKVEDASDNAVIIVSREVPA